ncbi:hypothetical protein B0H67DRAFT_667786 [Lasiosphaeris hirsuta]|uniref:Uncharacterized protein n=1 Tax=Lasiosphaeris hirsuta TaxID=260670 RepID=A0AA40A7Z0_9PEZI|nr:hypothetical protein B0H67DRAFT_667786 [Lasiosphaeris hirsuta]
MAYPAIFIIGHEAAGQETGEINYDQVEAAVQSAIGHMSQIYFEAMSEVNKIFMDDLGDLSFAAYDRNERIELVMGAAPTLAQLLAVMCCNPYCRFEERFLGRIFADPETIDNLIKECPNLDMEIPPAELADGELADAESANEELANATADDELAVESIEIADSKSAVGQISAAEDGNIKQEVIVIDSDSDDDDNDNDPGVISIFDPESVTAAMAAAVKEGMDGVGDDLKKYIDAKFNNIATLITDYNKDVRGLSDKVAGLEQKVAGLEKTQQNSRTVGSGARSPSEQYHSMSPQPIRNPKPSLKRARSDGRANEAPVAKKRSVTCSDDLAKEAPVTKRRPVATMSPQPTGNDRPSPKRARSDYSPAKEVPVAKKRSVTGSDDLAKGAPATKKRFINVSEDLAKKAPAAKKQLVLAPAEVAGADPALAADAAIHGEAATAEPDEMGGAEEHRSYWDI